MARFDGSAWTTEYIDRLNDWGDDAPYLFAVDAEGRAWSGGNGPVSIRDHSGWSVSPFPGGSQWGDIAFDSSGHAWISKVEDRELILYTTSPEGIVTAVHPGEGPPQPRTVWLGAEVPNPFNPRTTISYSVPHVMEGELVIYDLAGRQLRTLLQGILYPGTNQATWNGTDDAGAQVASGVYLYQLRAGEYVETKRMVLLK